MGARLRSVWRWSAMPLVLAVAAGCSAPASSVATPASAVASAAVEPGATPGAALLSPPPGAPATAAPRPTAVPARATPTTTPSTAPPAQASPATTSTSAPAPTTMAAATPAGPPSTTAPVTTPPHAAPTTPAVAIPPSWEVGATLLPLRPDGYGEVQPTPEALRDRRLPTTDHLPPPADGGWHATVAPVDQAVLTRIGAAWTPGCPVPPEDLRLLTLSFWGFDDGAHTGEMIVAADAADDIVWVFEQLFAARFPLEAMRLATGADLDAAPTGDGNGSGAFVCRDARGSSNWSAHAYGLAVDVNPFHNPYQRGDLVLPELASAYLDRGRARPGMVLPGEVVTESFAAIGWGWGGSWTSMTDTMHFSATGH